MKFTTTNILNENSDYLQVSDKNCMRQQMNSVASINLLDSQRKSLTLLDFSKLSWRKVLSALLIVYVYWDFKILYYLYFKSQSSNGGVPQSNMVGPVFYLLYTCDLLKTEHVTIATYDDDTGSLAMRHDNKGAIDKLQQACNNLTE